MDLSQRDALVIQYLPLVKHVVVRLWRSPCHCLLRRGLGTFEDSLQTGYVALLLAASYHSAGHKNGASFKTYAYEMIVRYVLSRARRSVLIPNPRSLDDSRLQEALERLA